MKREASKKIKKEEKKKRGIKKEERESKIPVYNLKGEEEKRISLPKEILSVKINERLLAHYVYVYLANQRQKNVSTKTRGEVTGSTRKIYRQKGTGRARHGDIKAPIFVGGGVVGGPKPYKRYLKINKKQKRKALYSSLLLKFKNNDLIGFSSEVLNLPSKTKKAVDLLKKIDLLNKKILFVMPNMEKNSFILAMRNIPGIDFVDVYSINPYFILKSDKVIFFEPCFDLFNKHFLKINLK